MPFHSLSVVVRRWEAHAARHPHQPFIRLFRRDPPTSPPSEAVLLPLSSMLKWTQRRSGSMPHTPSSDPQGDAYGRHYDAVISLSAAVSLSDALAEATAASTESPFEVRVVVSVTSPTLYALVVLACWRKGVAFLPVDRRREAYAVGVLQGLGATNIVVVDDEFALRALQRQAWLAGAFSSNTPVDSRALKRVRDPENNERRDAEGGVSTRLRATANCNNGDNDDIDLPPIICSHGGMSSTAPTAETIAFWDRTTSPDGFGDEEQEDRDDDDRCSHVIFTSGTTGAPKLVHTSRRNISIYGQAFASRANMVLLDHDETKGEGVWDPQTRPRILAVSASSFDPSVGDVIAALLTGGELITDGGPTSSFEDGAFTNVAGAIGFLTQVSGFSHCVSTPAVWASALPPLPVADQHSSVVALPHVFLGGERMSAAVAEKWSPLVKLYNIYGLTEGTVYQALSDQIRLPATSSNVGARLGSPLHVDACDIVPCATPASSTTSAHASRGVVELAPTEEFELCLVGPMVSKGYINERDPPRQRQQVYSFSTGDWARRCPVTGEFIMVGRRDGMVKINGIRTALEEVEHSIASFLHTYYCNADRLYEAENMEVLVHNAAIATRLKSIATTVATSHGDAPESAKAVVDQHLRPIRGGAFFGGRARELEAVVLAANANGEVAAPPHHLSQDADSNDNPRTILVAGCCAANLPERGLAIYCRLKLPQVAGVSLMPFVRQYHPESVFYHDGGCMWIWRLAPSLSTQVLRAALEGGPSPSASVPAHHFPKLAVIDVCCSCGETDSPLHPAEEDGDTHRSPLELPDTFVTPNGKRDRVRILSWFVEQLATLDAAEGTSSSFDPTVSKIDRSALSTAGRVCVDAWQAAIGADVPLSMSSSFTFMGGDSLMAAMVMRTVALALRPQMDVDNRGGGGWIEGQLPPELAPHLLLGDTTASSASPTPPPSVLAGFISYIESVFPAESHPLTPGQPGNDHLKEMVRTNDSFNPPRHGDDEVDDDDDRQGRSNAATSEGLGWCDSPTVHLTRTLIQYRQCILLDILLASGTLTIANRHDSRSATTATLLHLAVALDDPVSAAVLLHHGSKVTTVNEHNMTPAFLAAEGKLQCLRLFVAYKLPVTVRDRRCQGLMHAAARRGAADVLQFCISVLNLDHTTRDCWQRTPLHWAIINGHRAAVETLLTRYEEEDREQSAARGRRVNEKGTPPRSQQPTKAHWAKLAKKTTHATYLTPLEMMDANTHAVNFDVDLRARLGKLNLA